jgi:hypothetical protein
LALEGIITIVPEEGFLEVLEKMARSYEWRISRVPMSSVSAKS